MVTFYIKEEKFKIKTNALLSQTLAYSKINIKWQYVIEKKW